MTRDGELKRVTIEEPIELSSVSSMTKLRAAGGCRVIAELGHGGMANVYLVVNHGRSGVNKLVVFKALRPELASEPEVLAMFLDEARVAAQLNHPNVVQSYEVGVHEGRNVLVMEYLEGQSLSRLIRESERYGRPLPLRVALQITIAALEGLHYVHELTGLDGARLELVHRDVSPQNIFVTYDGQVKLLDFGIAKAKDSSTHTAVGVVKGKVAYMAPEQMACVAVDRRADIYAVGCMLWAFATGRKLWHGVPDPQVMARVLMHDLPSPFSENPNCDRRFAQIVMKAMAAHREDRYSTALELQLDLEDFADQLGPPIKQKELGALVSELFSDTRAQIRQLIESQLAIIAQNARDGAPDLPAIHFADELSISSSGPQVLAGPQSSSRRIITEPPRTGRVVLGSIAAVTFAALASAAAWRLGSREATEAANMPASQAESSEVSGLPAVNAAAPAIQAAAEGARPALATIQFDVQPPTARLFLDGVALAPEIRSRVLPADGSKHTLRAEARGHQPAELDFVAARDTTLALSLVKAGPEPRKVSAPAKPGAPKSANPESPAAPAAPAAARPRACADPIFVGPDGIMRVRPECL